MTQGRHPDCKVSDDGKHDWNHLYFCVESRKPKTLCDLCGYCLEDRAYHIIQEGVS